MTTELALDMTSGLPMINVKLWSRYQNVYRSMFIAVDTGATVTTLSKDILHILGYDSDEKPKVRITTASGVEYVNAFKLDRMKLGKIEIPDVEVYGHTFPQESFSSGVVGINLLQRFDVHLLFSCGKMELKQIVSGCQ